MRAVVQRVTNARVDVNHQTAGRIGPGLLVYAAAALDDGDADVRYIAEKVAHLRIFPDDAGKMNRSLIDISGYMLVVSQFTLLGDCRKGRRPSFINAAAPEKAERFYDKFVSEARKKGLTVETGRFQAMMDVALVNDGPVTLIVESKPKTA